MSFQLHMHDAVRRFWAALWLSVLLSAMASNAIAQCLSMPRGVGIGTRCLSLQAHASQGAGGLGPGLVSRTVVWGNQQQRSAHLYFPMTIDAGRALPLLVALHGTAGNPAATESFAQAIRAHWQSHAESNGFAVLALKAGGASGGWLPGRNNDYAMLVAAIKDTLNAYNIDRNRIYLWGYSSGGHVAHDLALWEDAWLQSQGIKLAAYGVNAGVLRAVAGSGAPAQAGRKIPLSVQIGLADPLLTDSRNDRAVFQASGWAAPGNFSYLEFNGGHYYDAARGADPAAMAQFLLRFAAFESPALLP